MQYFNVPLMRLCIALAMGILCAYLHPLTFPVLNLLPFLVIGLLGLWLRDKRRLETSFAFTFLSTALVFVVGYHLQQQQQPRFQPKHFSHFFNEKPEILQLTIREVVKPSKYQENFIAEINQVGQNPTRGLVLLHLKRTESSLLISVDKRLWAYGYLNPIAPPKNPGNFNFQKYMAFQNVYYELTIAREDCTPIQNKTKTLKGWADWVRRYVSKKLVNTPLKARERAIVKALILGDRRDIEKPLYEAYAAAGAVHILAVSGLHVGIVMLLFQRVLSPLARTPRGKIFIKITTVLFLWGFAFIAGLSPSVVRAVTMFSFITFAAFTNRPTQAMNLLFLSFFFLLLFKPNWLFQVGFQMSFLAVFFIVWMQPKLSALYRPRYWVPKKIWDIVTVTLSAQLGVAPLSIFYFHQFPGLFLVTNLVVLPLLSIIISCGILFVAMAALNLRPHWFINSYQFLLEWLNGFMDWAAKQNGFLFQGISLSLAEMLLMYCSIISISLWWHRKQRHWIFGVLGGIVGFLGIRFYQKATAIESLIVYQQSKVTTMAQVTKNTVYVFTKDSSIVVPKIIKDYQVSENKKHLKKNLMPEVFTFDGIPFLIIDSLGVYPPKKNAVILLCNSPKVHLERLINEIQPMEIIADGSNYASYLKRWKSTCAQHQIPFYSTWEKGARIWTKPISIKKNP
ncbi:MAG: ComEC/Rec2 family competence protein [Flavobacteriaceae bacterium]